jgi:hypothetical protein
MLTAAVRDLHRAFPGLLVTDVRTPFTDLWANNPYITPLNSYDPEVEVLPCGYPLVNAANSAGRHVLHGFLDFFSRYFGKQIPLTEFKGDIHLSRAERRSSGLVCGLAGCDMPFWIMVAGGRLDNTIKWWDAARYQEVVDYFRGRIQFVQVGGAAHYHPKLSGVIDLRGRTSVRDLVTLVHHSQGIVCGVTGLMHLAAAVPRPRGSLAGRPCIVIAGGRESPVWEAYPGHQFIHTVGALPCCAAGGCWKARTKPLGDESVHDQPDRLCVDVRGSLPRCMDMITSNDVIRRIETYFEGGQARYLSATEANVAKHGVAVSAQNGLANVRLNLCTAREVSEDFIRSIRPYPNHFRGRGIVIAGGGVRMFTSAWVCIRRLRDLGCALPIQLWHIGPVELDAEMRELVAPFGVECIDALAILKRQPASILRPWALKPYSILHCRFEQVLLLDADNVPVANPELLFEAGRFRNTGAVFWPDYSRTAADRLAWTIFGVPYQDEPEFESGQILVDKRRCWSALVLSLWYNEHSDFYYQHVHGDKDTFRMAFRKLDVPYAMPRKAIHPLPYTMCQHDFHGRRMFQHRNGDKWNLLGTNRRIPGFWFEKECFQLLKELSERWDGRASVLPRRGQVSSRTAIAPRRGEVKIAAFMISCPERRTERERTLKKLAATDWRDEPIHLQLDEGRFPNGKERSTHTAWLALKQGLSTGADYILLLEDDLEFNRHFRANLFAWAPLRKREAALASLYYPGVFEMAWDVPSRARIVPPQQVFASQALVFSRRFVRYALAHWFDGPVTLDQKAGRFAEQLGEYGYYHCPSLVQHVGRHSLRGERPHRAPDFDRDWKASAQAPEP